MTFSIEYTVRSSFFVGVDYLRFSAYAVGGLFRRPLYLRELLHQCDVIGVGSLWLSIGIGAFIGIIMPLHLLGLLPSGTVHDLPSVIGSVTIREIGPTLTAVILAGRLSAGIAAELASMKVTEEVDALRAMGVDVTKSLVTTKLVASVIMLPLLIFLVDIVAILGSWVIIGIPLGVDLHFYINAAVFDLSHRDMGLAIAKALVSGFIVATVGCYCGLRAYGGTVGIARSATQGVVSAGILILIFDVFFTHILTPVGV
tara:strand:- start:441 stop:1211 length:771 start_codon:yes stop_codon:yes gene_type:complete